MAKIMIGKYEGTIYSERGGYTCAPGRCAGVTSGPVSSRPCTTPAGPVG